MVRFSSTVAKQNLDAIVEDFARNSLNVELPLSENIRNSTDRLTYPFTRAGLGVCPSHER